MIIRDGKRTLRVKVLRPDVVLERTKSQQTPLDRFMRQWRECGSAFGWKNPDGNLIHLLPWTSEDFAIAKRLLSGASFDQSHIEVFFWLYAEPLRKGYRHPLRLFSSVLPEILEKSSNAKGVQASS